MDLTKLKELISKVSALYQDIEIEGLFLAKCTRVTCPARWDMIKPHLKDNSVMVDVGSDLGYFTQRIAQNFKNSVIISFEHNSRTAEVQKEIFKQLELFNAVVCNYKLWSGCVALICLLIFGFLVFKFAFYMIEKFDTFDENEEKCLEYKDSCIYEK